MFVNICISAHMDTVCPKPIWRLFMGGWELSALVTILEDLARKSSMSFGHSQIPQGEKKKPSTVLYRWNIHNDENMEIKVREEWWK